jgi:hypothetical protein
MWSVDESDQFVELSWGYSPEGAPIVTFVKPKGLPVKVIPV